jgi:adenosine deaminase
MRSIAALVLSALALVQGQAAGPTERQSTSPAARTSQARPKPRDGAADRFHVGESVRVGHARRIGHGAAVMYENGALDLLKEMAAKRVLVEIALTSNDMILGIKAGRHPLRTYLQYGVPVALVTDDAGVARSSMTLEYRKGVEEQDLDYPTLKVMAHNSIAFGFADAATKQRLQSDLDAAFRAFESKRRTP